MLAEALEALAVVPGGTYIDATFGAGGHTRALVACGAAVVAFDRDPAATLGPELAGSVTLVRDNFANLAGALDDLGIATVDGVLFDFGVSSRQFDRPERGFSLAADGPLDMRMNPSEGRSAYDLLATAHENELADIIFTFGDERAARRIARKIVQARERGTLPTHTLEFARMVAGVLHVRGRRERIHPATRTFQALRIAVNGELDAIERGLEFAIARTRAGGRIAAISFHSLEDRIVKLRFRSDERVRVITRKPLLPGDDEQSRNPRSRSAKLRVAERLL